jgi:periplasmic protein TonB
MTAPDLLPDSLLPAPTRDRLLGLILLMALLHAILLLGITFGVGPQSPTSRGMEVILASDDLPEAERNERAAYTAQRTQLGAGNTRDQPTSSPDRRRPAPATPPEGAQAEADDPTLASSGPSMTIRYMGSVAAVKRRAPEEPADEVSQTGRGDGPELVLRGDPNTGRWLSPDTQGSILAPYLDQWRRKIERLGTLNYPTIARDHGHRGAPVIEVALRYDGVLEDARVQGGSGDAALDQAALHILKLASPFNPFPPELAAKYRIMRFAYQWQFVTGRASGSFVTSATEGAPRP